jgi:precorrin-3B C17-methyltransferase / cobalt-factor III methyltransferase
VIFARSVTQPDEDIEVTTLGRANASQADMRTIIIVGSSATKLIPRGEGEPFVYTPRHVELAET